MQKQRVLLICSQHLFGESIETVLRAATDLELIGPWQISRDACEHIADIRPDVVVIVDEDPQNDTIIDLTASIIERYPELSVIRAGLNQNTLRVFSTHTLPARGPDLFEIIHNAHPVEFDKNPPQN